MSKPLSLYGRFILFAIVLVIFGICLYLFKLETSAIFLLFVSPILIVLLGKIAELIIYFLERISTGPLSFIEPRNTLLLTCYYAVFSMFLALLIENSAILTLISFKPPEWQIAIISLGLAFLPRILSYASSMERARSILLAILTPLTLTAAIVLFIPPSNIGFRLRTLEFCVVGSIIQSMLGDLTLYFAGFLEVIHPKITIETISIMNLRRLVSSQLETLQWKPICQILMKAVQVNRVDIVQDIMESMKFFIEESRRRKARLARIAFVDTLIETCLQGQSSLRQELIPFFDVLKGDQEAAVRARLVYCYAIASKWVPDKALQAISEMLGDNDMEVLNELGDAVTFLIRSGSKEAVSYAIKLSLNPAFLDYIFSEPFRYPTTERRFSPDASIDLLEPPTAIEYTRDRLFLERRSRHYILADSIFRALKFAYKVSPEIVLAHIQNCSLDKDLRLRVLAAEIVSDPSFGQNETTLIRIRKRLKKDKHPEVAWLMHYLDMYRHV